MMYVKKPGRVFKTIAQQDSSCSSIFTTSFPWLSEKVQTYGLMPTNKRMSPSAADERALAVRMIIIWRVQDDHLFEASDVSRRKRRGPVVTISFSPTFP